MRRTRRTSGEAATETCTDPPGSAIGPPRIGSIAMLLVALFAPAAALAAAERSAALAAPRSGAVITGGKNAKASEVTGVLSSCVIAVV
jgi:hypothetical protein